MDEPVRWVMKAEAAEELEISLSTLDRMIRRGEVEVVREGRRVYVRMYGTEYLSDEELLEAGLGQRLSPEGRARSQRSLRSDGRRSSRTVWGLSRCSMRSAPAAYLERQTELQHEMS